MGVLKQTGATGEEVDINLGSRCLLGRHAGCDVRVDNPHVSGEHASLRWVSDHWELRDLDSRNGTFVNGRRLAPGVRRTLERGESFTLGSDETFTLTHAGPPLASARHRKTGALRVAAQGLLVLPDDERPEVTLFEDPNGLWVVEDGEGTRSVADREIVIADGEGWILDLPSFEPTTVDIHSVVLPTLDSITLRFGVSRDEEHVELTVVHDGKTTSLPPRSHYYLLLTLARARLADEAASPAERGWVDREQLCQMLATDARKLNVDVFRVRRQLASLGVHGAAGVVARRPGTGQLRLGTDRIEVNKL